VYGFSYVHFAVQERQLSILRFLFHEAKCDVHAKDPAGDSALTRAVMNGSLEMVQCLVDECECDPESPDGDSGWVAIHFAAAAGHVDVANFLHKRACDMNAKQAKGYNALQIAVCHGRLPMVRYLIEEAKVDARVPHATKGWNLVMIATSKNRLDVLRYLVETAKCSVEEPNSWSSYPLHVASRKGYRSIIEFLVIEAKCRVDPKDDRNRTPLHFAASRCRYDVVRFLILRGKADVFARTKAGCTALQCVPEFAKGTPAYRRLTTFLWRQMNPLPFPFVLALLKPRPLAAVKDEERECESSLERRGRDPLLDLNVLGLIADYLELPAPTVEESAVVDGQLGSCATG